MKSVLKSDYIKEVNYTHGTKFYTNKKSGMSFIKKDVYRIELNRMLKLDL